VQQLGYFSKTLLPVLTGAVLLSLLGVGAADAALVRRSFSFNATSPYTGTGFFDYDDALLQPSGDPSGNQSTQILAVVFGYTGQTTQLINDPLSRVNFDSIGGFLGLDLELPAPLNQLDSVLIANENIYLPADSSAVIENIVNYGVPTPVPTPAMFPSLIALGWGIVRRKSIAPHPEQPSKASVSLNR
jgi:hypothetical protein